MNALPIHSCTLDMKTLHSMLWDTSDDDIICNVSTYNIYYNTFTTNVANIIKKDDHIITGCRPESCCHTGLDLSKSWLAFIGGWFYKLYVPLVLGSVQMWILLHALHLSCPWQSQNSENMGNIRPSVMSRVHIKLKTPLPAIIFLPYGQCYLRRGFFHPCQVGRDIRKNANICGCNNK